MQRDPQGGEAEHEEDLDGLGQAEPVAQQAGRSGEQDEQRDGAQLRLTMAEEQHGEAEGEGDAEAGDEPLAARAHAGGQFVLVGLGSLEAEQAREKPGEEEGGADQEGGRQRGYVVSVGVK